MEKQQVTKVIDVRAFPIEIGKSMLSLAADLNMSKGPTAYAEAEMVLISLLDVLTTYHKVLWPERLQDSMQFKRQKDSVVRFIELKQYSPMFKSAVARQLLDMLHYFPETQTEVTEPAYLDKLDELELHDACSQDS